jgi:hypothetical protein
VVIVQIIDKRFELAYPLLVSYLFMTLQAYFSPYSCDIDGRLSLAFLMNEFLIMLVLLCITHVSGWNDGDNGAVLIANQVSSHPEEYK